MSLTAAFRKMSSTSTRSASPAILHTSAPCPARSPKLVRPALPPPCAESATIRLWGSESPTQQQPQPPAFPRMQRSASEDQRPHRYGRVVMQRRETEKPVVEVEEKEKYVAVGNVSLVRSSAIRRAGRPALRKNKENARA